MHHDVIIIGAGPAGLCLAKALCDLDLKVAVAEHQPRIPPMLETNRPRVDAHMGRGRQRQANLAAQKGGMAPPDSVTVVRAKIQEDRTGHANPQGDPLPL